MENKEIKLEDVFNDEKREGVKKLIHEVKSIPKEEILANRCNAYEFLDFDKQETTLEETAENYWLNDNTMADNDRIAYVNGFTEGYKLSQERSYSEENMLKSFMAGIKCESNSGKNFEQFIKQFKKK